AVLVRARLAQEDRQDLGGPATGEEVHAEDAADRRAPGNAEVEHAGLQVGPDQAGAVVGLDRQPVHRYQRHGYTAADSPDLNTAGRVVQVEFQCIGDSRGDHRELGARIEQELALN